MMRATFLYALLAAVAVTVPLTVHAAVDRTHVSADQAANQHYRNNKRSSPGKKTRIAADVPSTTTSPASDPPATITLQGRIEELLDRDGANLPAEADKPRAGEINSFPDDWEGTWTGTMKVIKSDLNPLVWHGDGLKIFRERSILRADKEGEMVCKMIRRTDGRVTLDKPEIAFQANVRPDPLTAVLVTAFPEQEGNAELMAKNAQAETEFKKTFGDFKSAAATGETVQGRVLLDRMTELKSGVLENELLTRTEGKSDVAGAFFDYTENVIRFNQTEPGKLKVTAATVGYYPDGTFAFKYLIEGSLSQQEQSE